jgi:hypothetical protein
MQRFLTGLAAVMVGLAAAGVASGLYRGAYGSGHPPVSSHAPSADIMSPAFRIASGKHRLETAVKFKNGYYYPGKDHAWSVQHYDQRRACTVYWCPVTQDWYFWSERFDCYLPVVNWTPEGGLFDAPEGGKDLSENK